LRRLVPVRPDEARALLWSFAYFFCLLAAYYVLRPLRDEMGVAGGVRNLQWLFTATFVTMLAAVPIYGALVARVRRRVFIPLVYHFFVANLAIFWLLLALDIERQTVARVFFVWISVFVLFAVSVFWSFMADLYNSEQGKRLKICCDVPNFTDWIAIAVPRGERGLLDWINLFVFYQVDTGRYAELYTKWFGGTPPSLKRADVEF